MYFIGWCRPCINLLLTPTDAPKYVYTNLGFHFARFTLRNFHGPSNRGHMRENITFCCQTGWDCCAVVGITCPTNTAQRLTDCTSHARCAVTQCRRRDSGSVGRITEHCRNTSEASEYEEQLAEKFPTVSRYSPSSSRVYARPSLFHVGGQGRPAGSD